MALSNFQLWNRIDEYSIDDPLAKFPFSRRLARENGWAYPFALRCIVEYKRFCYLAIVADHTVTPSDEVDQVWHLHLTYSKDYWEQFCKIALEIPLHHGPTMGGRDERKRYIQNYSNTLESYRREFGEKPSADIWPDETIRFDPENDFRRLNFKNFWIIATPGPIQRIFSKSTNGKNKNSIGCGAGCGGCGGCGG